METTSGPSGGSAPPAPFAVGAQPYVILLPPGAGHDLWTEAVQMDAQRRGSSGRTGGCVHADPALVFATSTPAMASGSGPSGEGQRARGWSHPAGAADPSD